jgi:acetyltransferase-like isoleucine patch superfamily enzyme
LSDSVTPRTLPGDWYDGGIPDNVILGEAAYLETTYSFFHYRSTAPIGLRLGRAASVYLGTMFDIGAEGEVSLGDYALVHGARVICDASIEIGSYALISWNVVLMDSYRLPTEATRRRKILRQVSGMPTRFIAGKTVPQPIKIGANVWIGFDSCVLPGVTIGDGAIVGARSVVTSDVAPHTIVAGNPARFIRRTQREDQS